MSALSMYINESQSPLSGVFFQSTDTKGTDCLLNVLVSIPFKWGLLSEVGA